jgi:hypothetical protein
MRLRNNEDRVGAYMREGNNEEVSRSLDEVEK